MRVEMTSDCTVCWLFNRFLCCSDKGSSWCGICGRHYCEHCQSTIWLAVWWKWVGTCRDHCSAFSDSRTAICNREREFCQILFGMRFCDGDCQVLGNILYISILVWWLRFQRDKSWLTVTCSVFLGRGHVSLSVLSVPIWRHVSLSLKSFMTPSSLWDEFTPTKNVPLSYDPRTMILLLKSYSSSWVTVFLITQTRSSPVTRIQSR